MARLTKQDTGITGVGSAAAPARRRPASAPRKQAIAATVTAADATGPTEAAGFSPAHEQIATLAYSYWAERGYTPGSPEEDWRRAEAELRQRASAK